MQEHCTGSQFNEVYVFPVMQKSHGTKEGSLTSCIIDRGELDESSKFFTAHYKPAFVNPPTSPPMVTSKPMIMTDLSLPATLKITPRTQKISLTFNLKAWLPPKELCSEPDFRGIAVFPTPQEQVYGKNTLTSDVAGPCQLALHAELVNTFCPFGHQRRYSRNLTDP